jgi:hypothetical protein
MLAFWVSDDRQTKKCLSASPISSSPPLDPAGLDIDILLRAAMDQDVTA